MCKVVHMGRKKIYRLRYKNVKESYHMEELVVNGTTILQRNDMTQCWGRWRAPMNSVITFDFHKKRQFLD